MALTAVLMYKWPWGHSETLAIITVTGDTAYVPGTGYPLLHGMFHFESGFASTSDYQLQAPPINPVFVWADGGHNAPGAGGYAQVDSTTGNLRFYQAGGTEVAAGTAVTYAAVLAAYGH